MAITEDHCFVAGDWGLRILQAHTEHPEASVIGGAVENGATGRLIDWASFFVVQAAYMPLLRSRPARRLAGAVNVSYKRRALEALADHEGMGAMDVLHQTMLRERGEELWADDRIRVSHDQSLGVIGTTVIHFHAGLTMSGFRRQHMTPYQWLRAGGAFVVPIVRLAGSSSSAPARAHRPAGAQSSVGRMAALRPGVRPVHRVCARTGR